MGPEPGTEPESAPVPGVAAEPVAAGAEEEPHSEPVEEGKGPAEAAAAPALCWSPDMASCAVPAAGWVGAGWEVVGHERSRARRGCEAVEGDSGSILCCFPRCYPGLRSR